MRLFPYGLRLRNILSDMGAANGMLFILARIANRLCPAIAIARFYIVAQPVMQSRVLPKGRGASIQVLMLSGHDPLLDQVATPADEIERRFSGETKCFLALRGERVVGHLWVTHSGYRDPVFRCEYRIESPETVAWDFDLWIEPKERMGWAFCRLWDACNEYLAGRKIAWTLSRISAFNAGSLRAHQRIGIHRLRSLTYVCIGRLEWLLLFPSPSIRISRQAFPLLRVEAPDLQQYSPLDCAVAQRK